MKRPNVTILTIGIVAAAAMLSACGAPAEFSSVGPTVEAPAAPKIQVASVVSDEERLNTMQSSLGVLINDYLNRGQAVPEYLFDRTQKIEAAKLVLRQLDGQHDGLSMLVMQYCMSGAAAPDCVYDRMEIVQQSREETLNEIGLYE